MREGLEGAGDDMVALFDRLAQLRGLRSGVLSDGDDQPHGGVHHLHVLAHIGVEGGAVGDDDDGVEGFLPVLRDVADQAVCEPRDGFGLAGARGVLDEVAPAGAAPGDVPGDPLHRAELVVAGKDELAARGAALRLGIGFPHGEVA